VNCILASWPADRQTPKSENIRDWKIRHVGSSAADEFGRALWSDGSFSVFANSCDARRFRVGFAGAAEFLIDFAAKEISVRATGPYSRESIRHLLDDQILPRILAHEGNLVLHAAGVAAADGAVLIVGPSGSGKSSLAVSLHNAGIRLLGDDAIVVSGSGENVAARAVYRSLRLFPDSIAALVQVPAEFTPVAAYTTKRNVAYADDHSLPEALPIRAAFLLEARRGEKDVEVEPLASSEACIAYVEHSFWMDPTDLAQTKERILQASALAGAVPAYRLGYSREYAALPVVHRAITDILG